MHLRPERLRIHAADAADLACALESLDRAPGPVAELIDTVVLRARRELAEVEAALRAAATGAEIADHAATAAVLRIVEHP